MPKLREGDKANFDTMQEAAHHGHLCLVDAKRKSDGKQVALVCATNFLADEVVLIPLAVMVDGNPYEDYDLAAEEADQEKAGSFGVCHKCGSKMQIPGVGQLWKCDSCN